MTKQTSIKYISGLLAEPAGITPADQATLAGLRQSFPYFVPVRYAMARATHSKQPFDAAMLSAIKPYMGNWVLLCDYLQVGNTEVKAATPVANEQPAPVPPVAAPVSQQVAAIETAAAPPQQQKAPAAAQVITKPAARPQEQPKEVPKPAAADITANHWIVDEPATQPQAEDAVIEVVIDKQPTKPADATEPVKPVTDSGRVTRPPKAEEPLIAPLYTEDYFLHAGVKDKGAKTNDQVDYNDYKARRTEADKALMVMMSFSEWLMHFKSTADKQKEETKDQKALKSMWQKERLAAAMEEENEEIPENVFEMAVNSIAKEDGLASESLAEIYLKQEKYDKAIEMYRKLSLRNPQKNAYFARKIEEILKEKRT